MKQNRPRSLEWGALLFILCQCTTSYAQGTTIQLEISSQTAIDFTADQSSLVLQFSDFKKNTVTNTMGVTYSIMANDVVRSDDVVSARLDEAFPDISFQASFGTYTERGGDASLSASQPGFTTVGAADTGLAKKNGGKMLDGTFVITYQAKALEDQSAGEQVRTLTVTFAPV